MSATQKGFIQTPNGHIAVSRIVRFARIDSPGWRDNGQVRVWLEGGAPEGGVVLEPFAGSGTTLQVAKELGRRAIGIELNPEYLPMIERRVDAVSIPMPLFAPAGAPSLAEQAALTL